MKKFKELVNEIRKFKLPRGEQEIDSYMEKGAKGKKVPVVIAKKSNKYKVYVDGQELAQYKSEKEARKNGMLRRQNHASCTEQYILLPF